METSDDIRDKVYKICREGSRTIRDVIRNPIASEKLYKTMLKRLRILSRSLSDIRLLVDRLYNKATIDTLTGLRTRNYFEERIPLLAGESDLAFVIADIDKFHEYNYAYGHQQGDEALRAVGREFKTTIEKGLVDDEVSLTARYGGEELCAFIRNYYQGLPKLVQLGEEIRKNIETLEISSPTKVVQQDEGYKHREITVAVGIRKKDETIDLLVREVDSLLKDKDRNGRNKVYTRA